MAEKEKKKRISKLDNLKVEGCEFTQIQLAQLDSKAFVEFVQEFDKDTRRRLQKIRTSAKKRIDAKNSRERRTKLLPQILEQKVLKLKLKLREKQASVAQFEGWNKNLAAAIDVLEKRRLIARYLEETREGYSETPACSSDSHFEGCMWHFKKFKKRLCVEKP